MSNKSLFSRYSKTFEEEKSRLILELEKVRKELEQVTRERDELLTNIKILENFSTPQGGLGPK